MGSINKCLKWVFIIFNTIFALLGAGLIIMEKLMFTEMREQTGRLWTLQLFGGFMAGISILGILGAYKEKKWPLITFSVLVSIGMIVCLYGVVNITVGRDKLSRVIEDLKSKGLNKYLQHLQEEYNLECCGTDNGYEDWSSQIPESCVCPDFYHGTPKCMRVSESSRRYDKYQRLLPGTSTEVYREACVPFFMRFFNKVMDAMVGILFGLAIVALIGVIMAIIMICKIKKQRIAMPVPIYDYSKPPTYEELLRSDKPQHV